ncbi:30S ribosomal protein S17e [Candidatus Bathyarchaeota archaeon]|nr:30S ribosomal protein S17e [Candidatus Bathyarchaeota archaeon]
MGCVRTEHIKRIAKELVERFPDKFSNNFDENKRVVSLLVPGATAKVRNQVAGYITHFYNRMVPVSSQSSDESE